MRFSRFLLIVVVVSVSTTLGIRSYDPTPVVHAEPEPFWSLAENWTGWTTAQMYGHSRIQCADKAQRGDKVGLYASVIAERKKWKVVTVYPLIQEQEGRGVTLNGYCVLFNTK